MTGKVFLPTTATDIESELDTHVGVFALYRSANLGITLIVE